MPPVHPRACECPGCWRHRRLRMRHDQLGVPWGGSRAQAGMGSGAVGMDGGEALSRPEPRGDFALPSTRSGLLLAMGLVGTLVIGNRISRESAKGVALDEMFDGIIMGMAMYATLEQLRKIHNHEAQ